MNLKSLIFAACLMTLPIIANTQKTFLDDFVFRPMFRQLRGMMSDYYKGRTAEEAYRMNLKLGVSRRERFK